MKAGVLQRQEGLTLHKSPCQSGITKAALMYCTQVPPALAGGVCLHTTSGSLLKVYKCNKSRRVIKGQGLRSQNKKAVFMENPRKQLLKKKKT